MQAIILAGGKGTRLRSVLNNLPKPMAPIGHRPFLEIVLEKLAAQGFQKIVLSVGFMAETIIRHFGSKYFGMDLSYAIEEFPLGTGGGVRLALEQVTNNHVFVFNGDTYIDFDINSVEQIWQRRKRSIIIGREVPDTSRYGRLLEKDGIALSLNEKVCEGPGLINAGCYVINRSHMANINLGIPFSIESDFLIPAIADGEFDVFVSTGIFIDIGIPDDYERAKVILR
jgi:D-glycero-alpha-D-manno-heptose 1-phosphate guanylyltransferase